MITEEQYKLALSEKDRAEQIIQDYHFQRQTDFEARWKQFEAGQRFFTDAELRYAAGARCDQCNAGLAHPKECGVNHFWSCSAVLKGEASDRNEHIDYPFAFYEIKSEDQPSAQGATTRPNVPAEQPAREESKA